MGSKYMKCGSMMKIGDIWKFKNANNEKLPEYNYKKIYKSFEEAKTIAQFEINK
jgi:hypothetical protein